MELIGTTPLCLYIPHAMMSSLSNSPCFVGGARDLDCYVVWYTVSSQTSTSNKAGKARTIAIFPIVPSLILLAQTQNGRLEAYNTPSHPVHIVPVVDPVHPARLCSSRRPNPSVRHVSVSRLGRSRSSRTFYSVAKNLDQGRAVSKRDSTPHAPIAQMREFGRQQDPS